MADAKEIVGYVSGGLSSVGSLTSSIFSGWSSIEVMENQGRTADSSAELEKDRGKLKLELTQNTTKMEEAGRANEARVSALRDNMDNLNASADSIRSWYLASDNTGGKNTRNEYPRGAIV